MQDQDQITAQGSARGTAGEVFATFLKLGLTSFGGPIAHLGYFRDELVTRRKWLSDHAYADLVALCQFLPGPASSQVGFALGMMRAGWLGALAAFTAFTLPSALILLVFAMTAAQITGPIGTLDRRSASILRHRKEEPDHLGRGVGPRWMGVAAIRRAAGPSVPDTGQGPMLDERRARAVAVHHNCRAGDGCIFDPVGAEPAQRRRDDRIAVRCGNRRVRGAVKDDTPDRDRAPGSRHRTLTAHRGVGACEVGRRPRC